MPYEILKCFTKIYTELIAALVFYSEQHNDARIDRTRRVRTVIKNKIAKTFRFSFKVLTY